jgi:hypothetical protein
MDGQSPYQDGVVGIEDWKAFVINIHSSVFGKDLMTDSSITPFVNQY